MSSPPLLPRILLLCGEDPDLKLENLSALRQKAKSTGEVDWVVRDASVDLQAILNDAGTPSLFAKHTVTVVEGADRFLKRGASHKEDSAPLALLKRFEAQPGLKACLVLVTSLRPKTAEALGLGRIVACWPLEDREGRPDLTRWTQARARSLDKALEPAAAAVLLARTGNSLGRIGDALATLAIYVGGRPAIAAADVEALIGEDPRVNAFGLAEAAALGDAPRALRLLRQHAEGGERPESLCAVLAYHYRRLCQALARVGSGTAPAAAAFSVGVLPMFQAPFLRALQRLSPAQGDRALNLLCEADRRMKRGGGQGFAALERAVLLLCARPR